MPSRSRAAGSAVARDDQLDEPGRRGERGVDGAHQTATSATAPGTPAMRASGQVEPPPPVESGVGAALQVVPDDLQPEHVTGRGAQWRRPPRRHRRPGWPWARRSRGWRRSSR